MATSKKPPNSTGAANPVAEPSRVGGTVTVACKIAVAWFDLQLCEARIVSENTQTGPRDITQWVRTGKIVRIRGTAYPRGTPPEGFPSKPDIVGGYALTHEVSRDFFDAWKRQHAKAPYVVNDMIFAGPPESMRKMAAERSDLRSGLEPMIPSSKDAKGNLITDPRVPRSTRGDVVGVETEESRAAKMVPAE